VLYSYYHLYIPGNVLRSICHQWTLLNQTTPHENNKTTNLGYKKRPKYDQIRLSQLSITLRLGLVPILVCVHTVYKIVENRYIVLGPTVWLLINYKMPTITQNHQLLSNINTQKIHATRPMDVSVIYIANILYRG
jgi:hypothetical protein